MDTLHSVIFYAFAAVAVAGGLAASLLGGRRRTFGVAAVTVGLTGLLADLDAGFAALVTLVAFGGATMLLLTVDPQADADDSEAHRAGFVRQAGAALSAIVFIALAYLAYQGSWFPGYQASGSINTAALGRLLLGRDALAVVAVAAALLVAVVVTGALARVRVR